MTIAAARHHKTLSGVIHHLGLSLFHEDFGSRLVTDIDILAVLHSKGFHNLAAVGSEDLAIDHEVGSGLAIAANEHSHADDYAHH